MKRMISVVLAVLLLVPFGTAMAVEGNRLSVQMVDKSAYLQQVSTRRCTFQCKYVNNNPEKTVSGFDLVYMALDSDQNVSMPDTTQHFDLQINPGADRAIPTIYITNQEEMAYLIIAVQSVYFTDGSSETIDFANDENYNPAYFTVY